MTSIILPTFRGVKSLATVSTVNVTPGGVLRAVPLTHPPGTVIATPLGAPSCKIVTPLGEVLLPATEPLTHYRL